MFERPLRLRHSDEQRVFFTSDSHFFHDRDFIYAKRGYSNRYEHNEGLINKINECVRENDVICHLGDYCLNVTMAEFEDTLRKINCNRIYYIFGNHNSCIRKFYEQAVAAEFQRNDIEVFPYTIGKLTYLGYYKELIVNGQMIVLSHYPFQIWNQQQNNAWCLSGHSHYTNPHTQVSCKEGKILDLGWEGHHKPLSFDEVQSIMKDKSHKRSDDHH